MLHDEGAGEVALGCLFASMLAVITLTDLERRIIPNVVVGFGAVAGLVAGGRGRSDAASLSARSPPPPAGGSC